MRVGLMVEGQEDVTWDEWVALATTCEAHGFDALFRSDHYVGLLGDESRGALDAWATLSALGAVTERIRLGTLVSPVTFRHPSNLAKVAVTADHASGGRVELGMGAAWNAREHAAYGFPFPDVGTRYDLFEEQVEIVRRLLTEQEVSFSGEHYTLEAVRPLPGPVQDPLPLVIGGSAGPRSLRIAARWADEYNTLGAGLEELSARRRAWERAWRDAGRTGDPVLSVMTGAIVAEDEEGVVERAANVLQRLGREADPRGFVDEQRERQVVGTAEQAVERLHRMADAGVDRVMLQVLDHRDLDAVRLIGERLVPAVA